MQTIYLDNNATTPLGAEALEAMTPFLTAHFGNPSSSHSLGAIASQAVQVARAQVAGLIGASPEQVFFCSSATEGINAVLARRSGRVVTSVVEHAATLQVLEQGRGNDEEVTQLPVDQMGQISLQRLEEQLKKGPCTVALLWANNETGVIAPIADIAILCERYGARLHVDAVQAAGKLAVDFARIPIASMVISAHKIFGPKGAAALIVRDPDGIAPWIWGGGQERGRRSGTENVPAIVGYGAACATAARAIDRRMHDTGTLRDHLESALLDRVADTWVNGAGEPRLANTTNVGFNGVDGETLAGMLDSRGIAVSTGSACHSRTVEPSHVLRAMTGSYQKASQSIRFSLSHANTLQEIDTVVNEVCEAVTRLR